MAQECTPTAASPLFFSPPWQSHVRLRRSVGLLPLGKKSDAMGSIRSLGRNQPVHRGSVGRFWRDTEQIIPANCYGCSRVSQSIEHRNGVAKTPAANICQQFLLACASDLRYNEHGISMESEKGQTFSQLSDYFTLQQPYSKVGRTCCPNPCRRRTEWRDAVHQADQPETWKQDSVDMSGMSLRDTRSKDSFITCYVLSSNHHWVSRECLDLGQYRL